MRLRPDFVRYIQAVLLNRCFCCIKSKIHSFFLSLLLLVGTCFVNDQIFGLPPIKDPCIIQILIRKTKNTNEDWIKWSRKSTYMRDTGKPMHHYYCLCDVIDECDWLKWIAARRRLISWRSSMICNVLLPPYVIRWRIMKPLVDTSQLCCRVKFAGFLLVNVNRILRSIDKWVKDFWWYIFWKIFDHAKVHSQLLTLLP